jgi:DNA adenine methylase
MLTCQFCGITNTPESGDFHLDKHSVGFWCEVCDGFTYLNENNTNHRFKLILEDKIAEPPLFNPPNIKMAKRISPYRYPGGKSKVIDYLYTHLRQVKSKKLISPFTGCITKFGCVYPN